jgi:sugar phosphate isomerase/epimerase
MKFGICAPLDKAADIKAGGADFIEENVQNFLQGLVEDPKWNGHSRAKESPLAVMAANCLVPGDMKIVGTEIESGRLLDYMTTVMSRAGQLGIKTLVFGSAGARGVPEGFDRNEARRQIMDFLQMVAPLAAENDVTLVIEPLNRKECNIITTVGEAMGYVKEINHPNVRCLVDSFHFWHDGDSLSDLAAAMPWISHVHVADVQGRVAPGESGKQDYRQFFSVIKKAGYQGAVCVECLGMKDFKADSARTLAFLKRQWEQA